MKRRLIQFIDTFYFLFRPLIPLKTYRYAVCGGSNMIFDTVLYFIVFNFILQKQNLDLYFVVLSAHIASLFIVYPVTFVTGFLLNRHITFQDSDLPARVQFFRYFVVGMGAILISYVAMKFFVDLLGFFPTPSRFLTIIVSVLYSYIFQSKFSFRAAKEV